MATITRVKSKLLSVRMRSLLGGSTRNLSLLPSSATTSTISQFQQEIHTEFSLLFPHQKDSSIRFFSTLDTYAEKKEALKALRTERFEERQARKERVKQRREGKPKNARKKKFEAWFLAKKKGDEIHDHKAKKLGMDWKINVAVVLQRLPIVLPDKPQWEKEYDDLRAYLNQFGRSYPPALFGEMEVEELEDLTDEAMLEKHLPRGYTPAPRETQADISGDVRTLDRRLKTWVYLTVYDSQKWQFPTVPVKESETLLDAAKRAIAEKVGGGMDIYYPSNCPMAVDMDIYKKEDQEKQNIYGEKTFFMVVQYDEGKITKNDILVDDFAWLEKKEFVDRIKEAEGENKSNLFQYLLAA